MQYCTRNPAIKKPELSDAPSIIDINDNMDVIDGIISKNNFNGAVDPGTGDDVGDGYAVNSHWWNTTDHKLFVAESVSTGAAVWRQVYPAITPAVYDVIVYQSGTSIYAVEADTTLVDSGTVGTDDTDVINAAIAACPQNGTLFIDSGTYTLKADTVFYLNGGTSNPYWVCLPILDGKNIHIFGAGIDSTILKLANSQHDTDHPVVMILCRETDIADPGFTAFTLADMTLDGNKANQTKWYYDGAGLILTGSTRSGGRYYNLKLKNSHNTGIYLGNNGSGMESNSFLHNIYVENPYAEGIFLDSAQQIIVSDCTCIGDNTNGKSGYQVGLYVNGNTDYQTRSKDHILINNINCIGSSVKFWCINDCVASNIIMDTEDCAAEPGCLIHSCTGLRITDSVFRSNRTTANSYGGATYIDSNSYGSTDGPTDVYFDDCEFDGYYGIHILGAAVATVKNSIIRAAHDCIYSKDVTEATTAITHVLNSKIIPTVNISEVYTGATVNLIGCVCDVAGTFSTSGTLNIINCYGTGLFSYNTPMDGIYAQALLNGSFQINQQAVATYTSETTPANNDDTYLLDQWILLSDGNDIVDVSQETSVVPTGSPSAIKFEVETPNKKFGICQIIENKDSIKFAGNRVSLQFKAKTVNDKVIKNLRAGILSWNGTADAPTSDIVSTWGAEGANITPSTNWILENTPSNLALSTSTWTTYKIENIYIDTASMTNLAIVIWVDDTDAAVDDLLYITDVQLNNGIVCTPYRHIKFIDDLRACKRFYETSYQYGTAPGTANTDIGMELCVGITTGTATYIGRGFEVPKPKATVITIYNHQGTINKVNDTGSTEIGTTVVSADTERNSLRKLIDSANPFIAGSFYQCHWIADARL